MKYIFPGGLVAGVVAVILLVNTALAAPPYSVGYSGTPVKTAVPGKPFTFKLQVKNTGTTVYSGVTVKVHVPEGLTHTNISPANSVAQDDIIQWSDVPIAAGKSFYPSITFTMDSGTALKTKLNVWVEVTGTDMEANSANFGITAVKTVTAAAASTLTSVDISSMFLVIYERSPTSSELTYWLGRRSDKPGRTALLGAMGYHKANKITH